MGKLPNGVITLALGAAMIGGGALDARAEEGSRDVESLVAAGTLDDGADLLRQVDISIDAAIAAVQDTAIGAVGDVLGFNGDIGTHDVKVDAGSGAIFSADSED